ncbi:RNA polymerase sigma factor [bacterium]|nr:RNA polymerase sigma factor [bacterium]MBU1677197.1 RNA polymerase sigma factor [bacterium]
MDRAHSPTSSLDELCALAVAGDERARSELFSALRVRFLQVAKRRVHGDHLEDVVQDALKIVLDKYHARTGDTGILVWSFTVLRNVIGNHYQSRKRDVERTTHVEDWQTFRSAAVVIDPTQDRETTEFTSRLEDAVAALARKSPRCGRLFANLLESYRRGGGQREVSQRALEMARREDPGISRNSFYVALHRCRAQLRALLDAEEGSLSHV